MRFARTLIWGEAPKSLKTISEPFGIDTYFEKGSPVAALTRVRLEIAKAGALGFTVSKVLFDERKRVSVASNLTRYVPIVDAVTPVVAVAGDENVKVPGPRTLDHNTFRIPAGWPSSLTVPRRVIVDVLETVWGNPESTNGASLT